MDEGFENIEFTEKQADDPDALAYVESSNSGPAQPDPVLWSPTGAGVSAHEARISVPNLGAPAPPPPAPAAPAYAAIASHPPTREAPALDARADVAGMETLIAPVVPAARPDVASVPTTPTLPPIPHAPDARGIADLPTMQVMATPRPLPSIAHRRARKIVPLWWVLIALLVLATAGSWLTFAAYRVPADFVASTVCADLTSGSVEALYQRLSPRLRAMVPAEEFTTAVKSATSGPQAIVGCVRQGAYNYFPGRSTAQAQVAVTRANGQHVVAKIDVIQGAGSWWIDDVPATVLGVDVSALAMVNAYCVGMTSQNIAALYALQDSALRSATSLADFTILAHLHASLDGKVTHCAIVGLNGTATTTNETFTVGVTWAHLGVRTGNITLTKENATWQISALSTALQGSDLSAIAAAQRFAADLASGNYADIYSLFSASFRGQATEQSFKALLSGAQTGLKYTSCQLNIGSFTLSGTNASMQAQLTITVIATKKTLTTPITLRFVQEKSAWHLSGIG